MEAKYPERKRSRLENYNYASPGAYFITVCTEGRKNLFWNGEIDPKVFGWVNVGANCVRPKGLPLSDIGKIVAREFECWNKIYDAVNLYSYVIMPNHLHLIVIISADDCGRPQVAPTLSRMVKQFKGAITKKIGRPIWQKSFYEHIIRNNEDFTETAEYIIENPLHIISDELYNED